MANKQALHLGSVTDEEKKRKKSLLTEGEGQVGSASVTPAAAPAGVADPASTRQAAPSVQDYDRQLEGIYQQYVERQPFSYDMENDPLYRHYRDQYVTQGQRAMQDTMGQAAALTGGYGSTYANVAGQQAYGTYLQQLSALVPELYGKAWERYQAEGDRLKEQYSMVGDMAQTAYDRQQDAYDRQKAEEQTAYDRQQDAYNRQKAEEQTIYDREMDKVNWQLQADQAAHDRLQDELYWQHQVEQDAYQREQDAYERQKAEEQTAYDREQDDYNRQKAEQQTEYERQQNEINRQQQAQQDAFERQMAQEQLRYDRYQDELYWQQQAQQDAYQREQDAYQREQDAYNRQMAQEQTEYDRQQDALDRQMAQEQLAFQREQAKEQAAYEELDAQRDLFEQYDKEIADRLKAEAAAASGSSSSGSSSGSSSSGSSSGSSTSHQEEWKDVGQTVSVSTPSISNIKLMQTIYGVSADGVWGSNSRAAAGYKDAATAWQDLNNGKKSIKTERAQQFYQDKGTRAQWKARGISDTEYDAMVTNWLKNSGLLPAEICWLKKQFVK